MKGFELLGTLWHDVRYGLRLMARTPGFSAIAVITLALGIGANTAIFSLLNAVMFRALPVEDPHQLVVLEWSAHKDPKYHWYSNYGGVAAFAGGGPLVLACVGLYGLLSYEVTRRTREIGIRMALGAQRAHLIRMVVVQGLALAATGIAIGVAAGVACGRLLTKFLYKVKASDPATLLTVTPPLIMVAIVAASVPARRATRVDPMAALRCE